MCGAPHVGFSITIRKINSRTSFDVCRLPMGLLTLETSFQYKRNPALCQRTTVSGHSDGVRIYRTYRPMNGQPMLPNWPNDGSSHTFRTNRESRSREAAGRRNWPESVPRKTRAEKGLR